MAPLTSVVCYFTLEIIISKQPFIPSNSVEHRNFHSILHMGWSGYVILIHSYLMSVIGHTAVQNEVPRIENLDISLKLYISYFPFLRYTPNHSVHMYAGSNNHDNLQ